MTAPTATFVADFSDQTGIFNPDAFAETVTVIGCGGIGASVLPTLVTMGIRRFVLWDPDQVEPRNVASQLLFRPRDLYRPKVEVAREYLLDYGATEVEIHQELLREDSPLEGVVIGGVDSMAARRVIWTAVQNNLAAVQMYFDGRIGGEHLSLFAVEPFDGDWYERRWLFDDAQAAELPCTERAIAYPAVALGCALASHFARLSKGQPLPKRFDLNLHDLTPQALFVQAVGRVGA